MKHPISKNINKKSQLLISWLDYYSILSNDNKQLLPMDSPGSELFNDIMIQDMLRNKRDINAQMCQ